MRALRPYLLLGLAVFLGVALATLPASLLSGWLPTRLELHGLTGTVWDGAADELRLDGTPLGHFEWHLHPASLLRGSLAAEVRLQAPRASLSGRVDLHPRGTLEVQDLALDLPLDFLHPHGTTPTWSGRIAGQVRTARLEQGWPVTLDGHFTLEHLKAPNASDDLGRFVLGFDPRDATAEALLGRLHDEGGPLSVTAQLRLEKARAYELDGDVSARGTLSDELARALAFLGSPGANGRRPLALSGTF